MGHRKNNFVYPWGCAALCTGSFPANGQNPTFFSSSSHSFKTRQGKVTGFGSFKRGINCLSKDTIIIHFHCTVVTLGFVKHENSTFLNLNFFHIFTSGALMKPKFKNRLPYGHPTLSHLAPWETSAFSLHCIFQKWERRAYFFAVFRQILANSERRLCVIQAIFLNRFSKFFFWWFPIEL